MEHPPTYMIPCDPFSHLHYTPVHLYSITEIVPFWHLSYTHILVYIGEYCCRKDSPKLDSRLKHTHIVHSDVSACMRAQSLSCIWLFAPHRLGPARPLCPWNLPGKHTGVGCHFLLQGISLAQRSDPRLLHWQEASLPLCHLWSESHSVMSDSLRLHGL